MYAGMGLMVVQYRKYDTGHTLFVSNLVGRVYVNRTPFMPLNST